MTPPSPSSSPRSPRSVRRRRPRPAPLDLDASSLIDPRSPWSLQRRRRRRLSVLSAARRGRRPLRGRSRRRRLSDGGSGGALGGGDGAVDDLVEVADTVPHRRLERPQLPLVQPAAALRQLLRCQRQAGEVCGDLADSSARVVRTLAAEGGVGVGGLASETPASR